MDPEQGHLDTGNATPSRPDEFHQRPGKGVETSQTQEPEEPNFTPPEENLRTSIMSDMMKLLEMAMDRQQETFTKMMADKNTTNPQPGTQMGSTGTNPTKDQTNAGERSTNRSTTFKGFLSSRPPEFAGDQNPLKCLDWLREMEQAFESSECDEQQKVRFASQMFRKQALDWWNIIRETLGTESAMQLQWPEFKRKVMNKYCNQRARDRMEDEF